MPGDDLYEHERFAEQHGINYPLLSDIGEDVTEVSPTTVPMPHLQVCRQVCTPARPVSITSMPVRTSEATWRNGVEDGDGEIELGSGAWRGEYSYRTRVTEEDPALSNPEELLAAGHAGCFAMAFANRLERAGHEPEEIHATARCHLELVDDQGPTITRIDLETDGEVPGIDEQEFRTLAQKAKRGCPVSRALAGVDISLEVRR